MHQVLRSTRGAAALVLGGDAATGRLRACGVGNISAAVVGPEGGLRQLTSVNGTLGHAVRRVTEFVYTWPRASVLVVHSDGLSSQLTLERYRRVARAARRAPGRPPLAGFRQGARRRDRAGPAPPRGRGMTGTLLDVGIHFEQDIVVARARIRRAAGLLGFDPSDQARMGAAVSEIARNALQHAGGGRVTAGITVEAGAAGADHSGGGQGAGHGPTPAGPRPVGRRTAGGAPPDARPGGRVVGGRRDACAHGPASAAHGRSRARPAARDRARAVAGGPGRPLPRDPAAERGAGPGAARGGAAPGGADRA